MNDTLISIRHLRKEYPDATPLKDVNAEIHKGEVISIIGPSGCGKSTFLRCINLLEKPTAGEILIDGVSITDPMIMGEIDGNDLFIMFRINQLNDGGKTMHKRKKKQFLN